eukprot:ctg_5252.g835
MPFLGGFAHAGITRSALRLYDEVADTLCVLQRQYPQHTLVLTGHSLGGGVASLLTMKMRWERPAANGTADAHSRPLPLRPVAYGFGTPACVSPELAARTSHAVHGLGDALITHRPGGARAGGVRLAAAPGQGHGESGDGDAAGQVVAELSEVFGERAARASGDA